MFDLRAACHGEGSTAPVPCRGPETAAGYECLNPEGVIAFDDYLWTSSLGPLHQPARGLDAFTTIYADRVDLLHQGYQCWFRKRPQPMPGTPTS